MRYRISNKIRDAILKGKQIPYWGSIPEEILHKSFELVPYRIDDGFPINVFSYKITIEECEKIGIYDNGGLSWCFIKEWVVPDISEKLDLI